MIRHLPWPKEQDWRAVMTQLSDHSDSHYQSRPCGYTAQGAIIMPELHNIAPLISPAA